MDGFFDLHCHILPGADDGAADDSEAFALLDIAYRDGIRSVCFTPHRNPYIRGLGGEKAREIFRRFCPAAKERFPDMRFSLGSEIMYYDGCIEDVRAGICFTMCGGKYLLTEFPTDIDYSDILRAAGHINSHGYRMLLAHAERYDCIRKKPKRAEELSEEDVLIQLNASLFRKYGLFEGAEQKRFIRTVFSSGIPFFVSTDAHGGKRTPILSEAYRFVRETLGEEAAHEIFWDIPSSIFRSGEEIG